MHRIRLGILAITLTATAATACGGTDRPSASEWAPLWAAATQAVPPISSFDAGPDREVCDAALSALRTERPGLEPTPDTALDGPADAWFEVAEAMFFDCPPQGETIASFADGYAELARFEQEIDAVLGDFD